MTRIRNLTLLAFGVCLAAATLVAQGEDRAKTATDATGGTSKETAAGDSAASGDATTGDEHPQSYLDFAMAGGYLMIPVGICSLLWLTFLVERLTALRRGRILPIGLESSARALPMGPAGEEAVARLCQTHGSSGARVLAAAASHISMPREEIEHAVNNAAQREIHHMRRYLRLFAVIAAVAPLLGLLGTVTGMIQAFREVAMQGLGSGKALAPGIYKALVTTAGGLIVAIPALLTHHWLTSRIDNYVHGIDNLVVDFVERHRSKPQSMESPRSPQSATSVSDSVSTDSVEAGPA